MLLRLMISTGICLAMSGCADLARLSNQAQTIPVTISSVDKSVGEGGAILAWPPYASAAVVDGNGNRCVNTAAGAKTAEMTAESALKLGKLLDKLDSAEVSNKQTMKEFFTKLSAADSRAAFADVALFHLCIFDMNGTFAEKKFNNKTHTYDDHTFKAKLVRDVFNRVVDAAAGLKPEAQSNPQQ